jgi:hypothetical protein
MPDSLGRPTRSDIPDELVLRLVANGSGALRITTYLYPWPRKLVVAKVLSMVDRGLLDYGVMPERPWLTDEGRTRLEEAS